MAASVGAVVLLLGSVGTSPLSAAQRDASSEQGAAILSAEADATPSPTPTPTPTPTPKPTPSPTPKPTPWPTPAGLKGVDVSHWNGYPDFSKLRDKGMRFAYSKATQGTSLADVTYQRHSREAQDAGLLAGAYHFFDYTKGGVRQAEHFLETLRKTTGLGGLLPLVVDVETLGSLGTPDKLNARKRLNALLDELYRQTGRYPMIYTSQHMWKKVVGEPTSFGQYPLWVACWKCDTIYLPRGWSDWTFWQAGQFRFGGGVKLDGNVYVANMDKLRLEKQRVLALDDGAEWAASKAVKADLRGYDGQEVRVAVDEGTFGPWQPYRARFDLELTETQGKQDIRLQLRSFRNVKSPVLREDIRLDSVPPKVDGPKVGLRPGVRVQKNGARVPTTASMIASDATSGLDSSFLKASCHGKQRASHYSTASSAGLTVQLDRRGCTVSGRADDAVGHRTIKLLDPNVALFDVRKSAGRFTFKGDWKTIGNGDALGRTLTRSASKGASAKLTIDGAQFAIVARRGPAGGRLKVILDGKHIETVDLHAGDGDSRRIVYVRSVARGKHTLKLVATGTGAPKASGSIVWLDAILVLDRRK